MSALPKPMDNGLSPLRVGRITGSRVGAILGLNPYSKRADVLREMVREHFDAPREFVGNEATEYGQAMESLALAQYEAEFGVMTYGGGECIVHPLCDFLAATPDGMVGNDGMIECKAPYRATYTHWREKPYYEAQMRLQMECAGRAWCDFAVLHRDGTLHVSRLKRDEGWLPLNVRALQDFLADYYAALESPEAHLSDKLREDSAWREAAVNYRAACLLVGAAEASQKAARERLLALAGDASVKGAGVQVIRSERTGSIAYAKALKDLAPDADLTPYTGKPSIVFTVKEQAA